ncbi:MAG: DUF302 domain-containing protein [Candidatus Heimdallarchaeota archaeon]|nr:DUF302 domain-containing protein [Candidatus Heimdallarchaeota archaeon]
MSLVISVELDLDQSRFEEIEAVTRKILAEHGFGILTEIDAQATLKKKIDVDIRPYKILGACNPPFAHKAIELIPEIGALLPCNVIIYENKKGKITVSAMNPDVAMSVVKIDGIEAIASSVTEILSNVIRKVEKYFTE